MTIKQQGGIFGRNPTFNDVTIDDSLTTAGNIISSEEGINTPTADGITIERPTGSASPTPAEVRMSSTTQGSDWSTTDPWGRVSFYMKDTSGGGGKVHASMEVRSAHSSGGRSRLAFKTTSSSADDLQNALVIEPDQGSGRHVTVSDGNLVIGTSGKGIDFSATSGTGTSELFDDYEEGTWTPTVVGTSSAGTGTYAANGQTGRYIKCGSLVHIQLRVLLTNHTGTGNIRISGLPFNSANYSEGHSAASISLLDNLAMTAGNYPNAIVNTNSNFISLFQSPTGGGATAAIPMDTSWNICLSASYIAA